MRKPLSFLLALLVLGPAAAQQAAPDDPSRPSVAVTGMIQAADDGVLILRTDVGRYVTLSLPQQYRITRRTDVSLDSLSPGDVVGVVWGRAEDGAAEALQVLVYPQVTRDAALTRRTTGEAQIPGLELRGVVQRIDSGASDRIMRLTHADGEAAVRTPSTIDVAIIEAASLSELRPFTGRARAIARQEEDGSLIVRAIEILW